MVILYSKLNVSGQYVGGRSVGDQSIVTVLTDRVLPGLRHVHRGDPVQQAECIWATCGGQKCR